MRVGLFILLFLVRLALSGPARRDCGQEKCFTTVNECDMTYGGCWTECKDGPTGMPTFTAPLCPSISDHMPSSTGGPAGSLITPPPALYTTTSGSHKTKTCSAMWLCVDHTASCGEKRQIYGGCYDICTSAPPVKSPPCSLSSSTAGTAYAIPTSIPEPGEAYTNKPASDIVAPAIDGDKALVMAEMPSAGSPAPDSSAATATAVEFRLASVNPEEPVSPPDAAETSTLVEAPANQRGAAIAKMMADKTRKPNTDNVPCWDKAICREVQLGIPSPAPVGSSTASSAASTSEPSAAVPTDSQAESPAESPAASTSEPPAASTSESSAAVPTDSQAESAAESPAESLAESPPENTAETTAEAPMLALAA